MTWPCRSALTFVLVFELGAAPCYAASATFTNSEAASLLVASASAPPVTTLDEAATLPDSGERDDAADATTQRDAGELNDGIDPPAAVREAASPGSAGPESAPPDSEAVDLDGAGVAADGDTAGERYRTRAEIMSDPASAKRLRGAHARIFGGTAMVLGGAGLAASGGFFTFALWAVGDSDTGAETFVATAAPLVVGIGLVAGGAVLARRGFKRLNAEHWVRDDPRPQPIARVSAAPWATTTGAGVTIGMRF